MKKNGMANKKRYKSTILRAQNIRKLTEKYYEPGNNARCYKAVWRRYIYPLYPMCYRTYLNYLGVPTPAPDPRQFSLLSRLFED